jgi:hypothetical protein
VWAIEASNMAEKMKKFLAAAGPKVWIGTEHESAYYRLTRCGFLLERLAEG